MAEDVFLVQGWTERITDTLLNDGAVLPVGGMTIELVAFDSSGTITLLGTAGVLDGPNGIVYYDPHPSDFLVKRRIKTRWKVTDGSGKIAFVPNSIQPEVWVISQA